MARGLCAVQIIITIILLWGNDVKDYSMGSEKEGLKWPCHASSHLVQGIDSSFFTEQKGEEEHPAQQRVMTFGKLQCYVDVGIYSRLKSNLEGITES